MRRKFPAKSVLLLAISLSAASLIISCSGGGGSTSSGGGGSSGASSTLILQVSSFNGRTVLSVPASQPGGAQRVLLAISNVLAGPAWAATAGVEVYLDGVLQGVTDFSGEIMFPITAGLHTIRLVDPSTLDAQGRDGQPLEESFDINVPADTIVTLSDVTAEGGVVTYNGPSFETGDEVTETELQNGQASGKALVCHKGKKTLSVGAPAIPAHLAHGDTEGLCPGQVAGNAPGDSDSDSGAGKADSDSDSDSGGKKKA